MADPLSIASACLAGIETIATVAIAIRKFVKDCRAAKSDLENVQETLAKLQTVFDGIKTEVSGPSSHLIDPSMRGGILSGINDCVGVIHRINEVVAEHVGLSSSKWVRNGKKQVADLQSSLETHRTVLQLAVSSAKLSLLISVKADTAALRRDVQQLLATRRRQRRPSTESTCETVITMAAEKLIKADPSAAKKPLVNSDTENADSTDYDNDSDDNDSMVAEPDSPVNRGPPKEIDLFLTTPLRPKGTKEIPTLKQKPNDITCSRVRQLEWYTDSHKTQCVAISPEGDIVAISSMKEVCAWDLSEPDDDMMRPPLQFDNGLVSWHVPTKLVLERDEVAGLILAASSSRISNSGLGGKSAETKLLVHSYETDKTLYTHTKSRRSVALALSFGLDQGLTVEVLSPSLRRTYFTRLVRQSGGDMKNEEDDTKFETGDFNLDDIPTGLSVSGEFFLAVTKRSNKHDAPVAFFLNTVTGEAVGKIALPDGCAPVTGIPILSLGGRAVLILWHEDTKETKIFRWDVKRGRHTVDSSLCVSQIAR
ncbi:hypothetical protein QBC34DRAFT_424656 [Podospora aff. communis PSN243]|uniref:Fungal N-terminal domain-containing protein n=1 Tax=Podospora aff. communis PSN243 TaxID=3040156 RepID=A0AAV9GT34_9PEZI|nr:hypothetical protein QBC34DRAFT_424656 [Podospora aff. communis PSN243]